MLEVSRYSGPTVRWDPPSSVNLTQPVAHALLGAVVGSFVAAFIVSGALQPLCVISGAVSGAAFGPLAPRARTGTAWFGIAFGLALTAIFVGAFVVGLAFVKASDVATSPTVGLIPWVLINVSGFAVGAFLIFGIFVLPLTLVAAMLWMIVILIVQELVGRRARSPGPGPTDRGRRRRR